MFPFVAMMSNLSSLHNVVTPPEAPLELMAFPTLNFQKMVDLLKTSSYGILVSWINRMSGFSEFMIFLRVSTLIDPPSPLQFQEISFIIFWMHETLLGA